MMYFYNCVMLLLRSLDMTVNKLFLFDITALFEPMPVQPQLSIRSCSAYNFLQSVTIPSVSSAS